MSSDDQYFLDLLSSIPNDVKRYSQEIADAIDRNVDHAAVVFRKTLHDFGWISESARPRAPPPPLRSAVRTSFPRRLFNATTEWVSDHRTFTAALITFIATGSILMHRRRKSFMRKRRAKRSSNGQRTEVVVIAGSPSSPITRSISLDLERRGFMVYVVVSSAEEDQVIKNESRADIRSLYLDITNPFDAQETVDNFRRLLAYPHGSASGLPPQPVEFTGLIIIPDVTYPAGPVEIISPELWSDMLNIKVLGTIVMAQCFLSAIRDFQSRVLVLLPAVVPALQLPFHGVEGAVVGAIQGFIATLTAELGTLGVPVCQFKLGAFNLVKETSATHRAQLPRESDVMSWPASARAVYGRNYFSLCDGLRRNYALANCNAGTLGSPLRELNNAVFDALTQKSPRKIWRVGRGSLIYDVAGTWLPSGIVGWMMGLRNLSSHELDNVRIADSMQSLQWEKVDSMA